MLIILWCMLIYLFIGCIFFLIWKKNKVFSPKGIAAFIMVVIFPIFIINNYRDYTNDPLVNTAYKKWPYILFHKNIFKWSIHKKSINSLDDLQDYYKSLKKT